MLEARRALVPVLFITACGGSAATTGNTGASDTAGVAGSTGAAPGAAGEPTPPRAARHDHAVPSPSGSRSDPYYWIRDDQRKSPEVLKYLAAENEYTSATLAPDKQTEDTLFAEMRSRIKEDDSSVPELKDGYWYYSRFETGKQQPIFCRRKGKMTAPEEVLLDGNQLAEGHAFYRIGAFDVTRNGKLIAWADDTVGRNQFALHIKEIASGKLYDDTASNIAPSMVWAGDGKTLFYTGKDETTLREDRVFRHVLGATAHDLVYKEDDTSYYVSVGRTKSRKYILFMASATTNDEVRLVDAARPMSDPVVFLPRAKDHEYSVDHLDGRFFIRTNADARNFRLVSVREGKQADRTAWTDVIPHSADQLVEEDFAVFHGFVAATVRSGGLSKVLVLPKGKPSFFLDAKDPTYTMSVIDLADARSRRVRYAYSSMVAPTSVFEADVTTKKTELLKQQPVPGYDPAQYTSEYLHAPASDGTLVPISVVYKKTTPRDGTAPLLVYGYGSYGISIDAGLDTRMTSLLDRGWVYAIAHIRGGQELGRAWYEDGKLMKKRNTFTDFIAATEFLVANKLGARDQVYAAGGSAGGLLMGAVLNMRPDLYRGVVAQVPFVDVVTTMLDASIPLTTNEFDEWGDPRNKAAYDYMLSYSPYDNVAAKDYPSIYVRTGLWDSQVQYYEPTKWVAKLRATKTDGNLLVLDVDMTSGHGGASGRFDRLRQTARQLAFLLHVHDRPDRRKAWPPK
ncbi:MAG TPA: S9 family peptidase [Kofleriaceae bacterium]|nr:S9 family peptidase [Kofleriaceae bacterium]